MNTRNLEAWVLFLETLGFLMAAAVIGTDEFLDAPHYLFGSPPSPPRLPEFWFEAGVILALGVLIIATTQWLFHRIRRLESFVVICSWCNKVRVGDEWIPVGTYLNQHHDKTTSHGLCPHCFEAMAQEGNRPSEANP